MNVLRPPRAGSLEKSGRLALGVLVCSLHVATSAAGGSAPASNAIPWDLALINGLQVTSESLGIHDRIRVVTLGTSGCTPRAASLFTLNPESGSGGEVDIPLQGRSIEFEIEDVARSGALLKIRCHARESDRGPPRTFTLDLDARKVK
ncbi:MAG: hypothetical protein K0Q76_3841 [Panacagrimonas sp.]|jgi:hypothetical protein|nr:hypothetical protein [Panacagrimonas sp.]MCC2658733.1 hypothetical protein [Panacagrimonas sp.]